MDILLTILLSYLLSMGCVDCSVTVKVVRQSRQPGVGDLTLLITEAEVNETVKVNIMTFAKSKVVALQPLTENGVTGADKMETVPDTMNDITGCIVGGQTKMYEAPKLFYTQNITGKNVQELPNDPATPWVAIQNVVMYPALKDYTTPSGNVVTHPQQMVYKKL